ncbi:MAG: UvrD-helicase domain-containing protein [Bacteroidetes bacterium]|nr:UvrD-helicase domain-containing protein [Bacteroidota bacterium]
MEKSLYIYKASAGAGKTFSLVVEYISILVENPANYAHILAVTFTNKATAEMKSRIMSVLYGLSKGLEPDYCSKIAEKTNIPAAVIAKRCEEALQKILHNYSHFSIETIDSFFQRVLRNMTRELGIGASFNLLLDDEEIVAEAIEETINHMATDADLKEWYWNFIQEQIEEGKQWNVEHYLQDFAKNLNKESFKTKELDLENVLNREFLENVKANCKKFCKEIEQQLASYSATFEQSLAQNGYVIDDFSNGKKGALGLFSKIKTFEEFTPTIVKAYANPHEYAWQPKNLKGKTLVSENFIQERLCPLFIETYEFYLKCFRAYNTAQLTIKNIHLLGLLSEIDTFKKQILTRQNSFLLSETANLLARIIQSDDGLDISFVYEKMGAHYQYIMIDEFQDTSHLNWENFKLLLAESLDNQNKSIIVGDAKQSIYRWNNGDWHIFTGIQQEFTTRYKSYRSQTELITLANNFRTGKTIVDFNNELFTSGLTGNNVVSTPLNDRTSTSLSAETVAERSRSHIFSDEQLQEITKIYTDDTKQIAQKNGGSIVCQLYDNQKDNTPENYEFEFIKNEILRLHGCGFANGDITILCIDNKKAKSIVAYFSENPLLLPSGEVVSFVSNEAFMYRSALSVRLIINALSYIANPLNTTALEFVKLVASRHCERSLSEVEVLADRAELLNKSLFDLVLHLMRQFNVFSYESEFAFIFSFLDSVYEFSTNYTSNITAFLQYWDETLSEKTIAITQQQSAVQLLTIHKAKGLEFPAVIIPFCDWNFVKGNSAFLKNYLWIDCTQIEKTAEESEVPVDFDEIKVLPVFKENLKNTYFEPQKQHEEILEIIDALNVLYVALTRPERSLAICGKTSKEKNKNVADVLWRFLENNEQTVHENGFIQHNAGTNEKFTLEKNQKTNIFAPDETAIEPKFSLKAAEITYSQTKKAEEFVGNLAAATGETVELSPRMLGIALHGILAQIEQADDCEQAIQNALLRGEIRTEHVNEIRAILQTMLTHPTAQRWFGGEYRILNEAEIICGSEKNNEILSYRPDRVMIAPDEVIIVDYKFSESKKQLARHKKQVQHYAQLLREIGYSKVSTFVWFALHDNEIIAVE